MRCYICNTETDNFPDPCDECQGVINETIEEDNEEDLAILDEESILDTDHEVGCTCEDCRFWGA